LGDARLKALDAGRVVVNDALGKINTSLGFELVPASFVELVQDDLFKGRPADQVAQVWERIPVHVCILSYAAKALLDRIIQQDFVDHNKLFLKSYSTGPKSDVQYGLDNDFVVVLLEIHT
jgi:hypothetical protein